MNKVIGTITVQENQILSGNHHIVVNVPIANGQSNIKAGMLLYRDEGDYKALSASSLATEDPVAIALEDMKGNADNTILTAVIHGAVLAEKLMYGDEGAITESAVLALNGSGIYALGSVDADPVENSN